MRLHQIGELEETVLLTVAVLFGDAYGFTIKNEIEERSGRSISIGALRTTLARLEEKGFLASTLGEPTKIRGGKRKRFYTVTKSGKNVLMQVKENRRQLWDSIPDAAFNF